LEPCSNIKAVAKSFGSLILTFGSDSSLMTLAIFLFFNKSNTATKASVAELEAAVWAIVFLRESGEH
jgi:hypothetical protein